MATILGRGISRGSRDESGRNRRLWRPGARWEHDPAAGSPADRGSGWPVTRKPPPSRLRTCRRLTSRCRRGRGGRQPLRLPAVTAVPAKTAVKSAPKAASWAYAEDFVAESEAAAEARAAAAPLGVTPIGRGGASALTFLASVLRAKAVVEIGTGFGCLRPGPLRRHAAGRHPDQRRHRGRPPARGPQGVPLGRHPDPALPADRRRRLERAAPAQRRCVRPRVHRRRQGRVPGLRRAGHPVAPHRRGAGRGQRAAPGPGCRPERRRRRGARHPRRPRHGRRRRAPPARRCSPSATACSSP